MITRLLIRLAHTYCAKCGWWVEDCGHPQN